MSETFAKGLYARVNNGKKFMWVRVEIRRKNPVPVENTTAYILRYTENGKRTVKPLGKDLNKAFIAWQNYVSDVERVAAGKAPIHTEESDAPVNARLTIADAVEKYLASNADKLTKNKKGFRSIEAYDRAAKDFGESVEVRFMDEITADVLLKHESWLYKNLKRKRVGKQQNTIVNRFCYLNMFLSANGIQMVKRKNAPKDAPGLLNYDDAPKVSKKTVDWYSPDEIKLLMDAATIDEADMIQFFVKLGVRDGEAAHAQWSDIKRTPGGYAIHIQEKPEFNWNTKNKTDRWIDLNQKLYERLMERKARQEQSEHNLIFPNRKGMPTANLIVRLHKVWGRVKAGSISGRPELHRFRRTFITELLASGVPSADVMNYSGHTSLASFQRYTGKNTALGKAGIEKMSSSFGD
jgi:integrase